MGIVLISKEIISELVNIVKDSYPNEATAYLFQDDGGKVLIYRPITEASRGHFNDNNPATMEKWLIDYGAPTAIFHSHPFSGAGGAYPSGMDLQWMINTIACYDCVWLIMTEDYCLRGWTLEGVFPREVKLEIPEGENMNAKNDKR